MTDHFKTTADRIWELDEPTIASIKAMGDRERDSLQAAIAAKYGKELDLNGSVEEIRDRVIAAHEVT